MIKFLLVFSLLLSSTLVHAIDSKKEAIDFLTQKTIADFQKGIEHYNQKKESTLPPIKRISKQNYSLVVKQTTVRFSLVNYLNDQMFVNDKLVSRSGFGVVKTSYLDSFITKAEASETDVDGETTKLILTVLGKFTQSLEEVGMMCFGGCQKSTREANMKKIINTLDDQRKSCNEQLYEQEDSIKKYPSFKMVSLLHSIFNPEFQSVRNFYLKLAETNKKEVDEFMSKKLSMTKGYENCMGVMTAGTVADGSQDSLTKGAIALAAGGPVGMAIEAAVDHARDICLKMDELKNCLTNLKKNVGVINTIKRNAKKASGIDYAPEESLPTVKALSK